MSKPEELATDMIRLLKKEDHYDWLPEIAAALQKEMYRNTDITVVSAVELSVSDRNGITIWAYLSGGRCASLIFQFTPREVL